MQHVKVKSEHLMSVGYDEETRTLEVRFVGKKLYRYQYVPQRIYTGLINAPSKGQYFDQHVRGCYTYHEVSEKTDGE
jgi:hypothetical protein